MTYPGDKHFFSFSISHADGSVPSVTTSPLITVINLLTGATVVQAAAMTLVAGTTLVYAYGWDTTGQPAGDYLAVVSYAADGHVFNGQFLAQVQVGDSRVTGVVALDATVAKDSTVAKDATVAHLADLATIAPDTSTVVLAIKAKTDMLPSIPASQSDVTNLLDLLSDVHDAQLGTWLVDKTQSPKILTMFRLDGSPLVQFNVTEDNNSASRSKI